MPSPNIAIEDVDAYSDSGSTISLASCGSGGNEFSPRPPRDGSIRSKSVKGRRSKVSNTARSPYASRQLPPRKNEATKSMGRNLWMTAMKNGTGTLSTNNTTMNTWAGARPPHANKKRPGSRTRNFSDVVDLTDGKNKFFSKSATMSYSEPYVSVGGPALKPAEDYYDEIIELKKIINLLKEENNRVNTKLHRVEEENVMKDRQIEDLLNSRKKPEDLRRTLTDKRGDSSSIVTSLKQKLHAVERTVKEKEMEISKMKRDLKTTDIEELKIQSEVYYQEVQRLQLALLQVQQDRMEELYAEDIPSSRLDRSPVSVPNQKLQKDMEALKAENKSLKKELISAVENHSRDENRKQLRVEYADMTRGQLLQTIHELEMRVDETETKVLNLKKENDDRTDRKGSKKRKDRKSSALSTTDDKESELFEENDKQRKIIEKLKEDRTHYRLIADDLRKQLKTRETEIEELQLQLSKGTSQAVVVGSSGRNASVASTSSQYSPRKESITAKEREEKMKKEFQEFQQQHAAKVLQKQWRTYKGNKSENEIRRQAEDDAAKTLQREWRKHLNKKESASQNEAITDIQAAFRGHLTRKERLNKLHEDDIDSDDAIVDLQSALRGHLTRTRDREEPDNDQWSRDILRDGELSESGDSEDDIVIGKPTSSSYRKISSTSLDKSPFSAKKRSSFTEMSGMSELTPPTPTPRIKPPPHPVPRTNKPTSPILHNPSQHTTPPSPAPRRRQPTMTVDSNFDNDDVVISGSTSVACNAPQNALNKSSITQPAGSSETSVGGARAEASIDELGLTKNINPQRTIDEANEESDDDVVVSGHAYNKPSSLRHPPSSRDRPSKPSRYEIADSDDDEDDVVVPTMPAKSNRVKSTKEIFDSDEDENEVVVSTKNKSNKSSRSSTKSVSAKSTKEIIDSNEEDDDIVVSATKRTKRPTKSYRGKSTNEIIDSDDEEENIVMSTKKSLAKNSSRSSAKSDRGRSAKGKQSYEDSQTKAHALKKVQRNQRVDVGESEDDSDEDDVVVTSSKLGRFGSKGSSSKYSKTSTPKRGSLVDSLLAPAPRTSLDNRGRKLIQDDNDDDDDDDDDMVMSSFKKRNSTSSSTSKKKDSLASLWSDSQPKKKSSFGFSSFEDSFSSKKRNISSLDEFF